MSIGESVTWFAQAIVDSSATCLQPSKSSLARERSQCILMFSHMSRERVGRRLLKALKECARSKQLSFYDVIFCYDATREDEGHKCGRYWSKKLSLSGIRLTGV